MNMSCSNHALSSHEDISKAPLSTERITQHMQHVGSVEDPCKLPEACLHLSGSESSLPIWQHSRLVLAVHGGGGGEGVQISGRYWLCTLGRTGEDSCGPGGSHIAAVGGIKY